MFKNSIFESQSSDIGEKQISEFLMYRRHMTMGDVHNRQKAQINMLEVGRIESERKILE